MYVRLVTAQVASDKVDEAIQLYRDSVLAAAQQQKGYQSAQLLVDRKTGKIISVASWETEADARASGEQSAYLQAQLNKFTRLFTVPPTVEHYEVGAAG